MNAPTTPTDIPKSSCPHRADSGWAWYYHEFEPTGNRKARRCWLTDEVKGTPKPGIRMSRNAVCDCRAGQDVPAKLRWTTWQGQQVPPLHTTLGHIKRLVERRRKWEGGENREET